MSTAGGGSRSLRDRRVARVVDRDIAPIWHDRFARLILRNLPPGTGQFVLDLHSGPGRLTTELLTRLDDSSRVLAIEPDDTLIELAKTRVRPEWRNRVYFKGGSFEDVFGMGAASYDLTIANLVLGEGTELAPAVGELLRVSKPGGHVLATLPLQGSWQEVEDIFAEVLRDAGLTQASRRLERLRSLRPPASLLGDLLREMNCPRENYVIESERLQMIFPSGREFLFAPVIEHGPLRLWKAIIGDDGSPQELFWRLKEAIDVYYSGHVLSVTVVAGLIHVQIPHPEEYGPSLAARYWSRYPELDRLWGGLAAELTAGRQPVFAFTDEDLDIDIDLDLDFGMDDDDEPEPAPEPPPQEPIKPSSEDLDYQPYAYGDEWEEDAEEAGALAGAIASGAAASSARRPVAEAEDLYGEPEPEPAQAEYEELTEDEPEAEYEELTEDEPEPQYEELAFEPEAAEPEPEPAYEELALAPEVAAEPEPAYEELALEPEVAAEPEPEPVQAEAEPEVAAEPELGGGFDADDEASFADLEGDEEDRFDGEDEPEAGSSIASQIEAELAEMSVAPAEDRSDEAAASAAEEPEAADEAAEPEAASEAEAELGAAEAEAAAGEATGPEAEAEVADAAADEAAEAAEGADEEADVAAPEDRGDEGQEGQEGQEAQETEAQETEAPEDRHVEHEAAADEAASAESDEDEDEDDDSGPKRLRLGGLPLKLGQRPAKPVKFRAPSFTPPVSTPRPKSEPGDDEDEGEGEGAEAAGAEARSDGLRPRRLPGLPGLPKLPGFKPPPKPVVREEPEDAGADEGEDEEEVLELEDDLIEVEELEELEDEEENAGAKPPKPPPPPPKSFKPRPLLPIVPPKPKKK